MILENSPEDIIELAKNWPLCLEFRLPRDYTAIVAGAYQGKVVQLLADLYPDYKRIIGYDPQTWAVDRAQQRLIDYPRVSIFDYAIGVENGEFPMGEWNTDACSFINTGSREIGNGSMLEFSFVMDSLKVQKIDLAVFNMEGYEFVLMPYLRRIGWTEKIDKVATQWHVGLGIGELEEIDVEVKEWVSLGHELVVDNRPAWTYIKRQECI